MTGQNAPQNAAAVTCESVRYRRISPASSCEGAGRPAEQVGSGRTPKSVGAIVCTRGAARIYP